MRTGCGVSIWGRVCIALALVTVQFFAAPAMSARQPKAAIVVDGNTGAILHAHDADAPRFPASLTKMMTIYLVFERLKDGRLKPTTRIRFSERASDQPPSKLGLDAGESISVINAVRALVTKSANDVATAVAEHIAGNEAAFARLMTARARQLGMRRTTFRNASGLPNPAQVTTARDMATLGLALQDHFPKRYRMFSRRRFTYKGRRYRNHNRLLGRFNGTDGIKTGYTRASGFNIATSVRRGRRHVVGVVVGHRSGKRRNAAMRRLLKATLPKASTQRTRQPIGSPAAAARPRLVRRPKPVIRTGRTAKPLAVHRHAARPAARTFNRARAAGKGRQPSTLGAQHARLTTNTINRPRRPAHPSATHHVQIGAYYSEADARNALTRVKDRARKLLAGARPVSIKIPSQPRSLYRARFAGFDAGQAAAACSRLKSLRIDCFVARAN